MSSSMKQYAPCVPGFIAAVVGAVVTCLGLSSLLNATSSYHWRSTEGKIVRCSVELMPREPREPRGSRTRRYHAEILYEFTVNGVTIFGDCFSLNDHHSGSSTDKEGLEHQFRVGRTVTVYYQPEDPQECVLQQGLNWPGLYWLGFGVMFLFNGVREAVPLAVKIRRQKSLQTSSPSPPTDTPPPPLPSNPPPTSCI